MRVADWLHQLGFTIGYAKTELFSLTLLSQQQVALRAYVHHSLVFAR
jgi:hypothetical protein